MGEPGRQFARQRLGAVAVAVKSGAVGRGPAVACGTVSSACVAMVVCAGGEWSLGGGQRAVVRLSLPRELALEPELEEEGAALLRDAGPPRLVLRHTQRVVARTSATAEIKSPELFFFCCEKKSSQFATPRRVL